MLFFLLLMCVGLVGLAALALPGLFHHGGGHSHLGGHGAHGGGHGVHVAGHGVHVGSHAHASPSGSHAISGSHGARGLGQFIPEPRLILSLMALYGAFGNVFERALHFPFWLAALAAVLPALLLEWGVVGPLWRLALGFQGRPSSPLAALVLEEARAVTVFRNGKGLVEVVRDGRSVQFSARLVEGQEALPVRVGDRLRIEDIDPRNERVTVSIV